MDLTAKQSDALVALLDEPLMWAYSTPQQTRIYNRLIRLGFVEERYPGRIWHLTPAGEAEARKMVEWRNWLTLKKGAHSETG